MIALCSYFTTGPGADFSHFRVIFGLPIRSGRDLLT
jgi:hypothetical protein